MSKDVILVGSIGSLKAATITAATFFAAQKLGYNIVGMTGASGGSILMPLLSFGNNADTVIKAVMSVNEDKLSDSVYLQAIIDAITPWKRKGDKPFSGTLAGKGLEGELRKMYNAHHCNRGVGAIPFGVVAALIAPYKQEDLMTLDDYDEITFWGDIDWSQAVRASTSIPVVFEPKEIPLFGKLVDGGLVDAIPTLPAIQKFGNYDIIMADATGDIFENTHFANTVNNVFDVIVASIYTAVRDSTIARIARTAALLKQTNNKIIRINPAGVKIKMFDTKQFPNAYDVAYDQCYKLLANGGTVIG